MPRAGTLFGSLKSLFKVTRNGSQRMGDVTPDAALATDSDVVAADAPSPSPDLYAFQASSPVVLGTDGVRMPASPGVVPKAFHRKLFSRSFLPARSPLSISETAICHSISDPFENTGKNKSSAASLQDGSRSARPAGGARLPAKTSRLIITAREGDSPILSSAEVTPPATYDNTRRCLSLDIPASSCLSSPPALGKSRLLLPVVLAAASSVALERSRDGQPTPSPCPSILLCSVDTPVCESPPGPAQYDPPPPASSPPPAVPAAPSDTLLLALCPGVPVAMRRRQWCVEDYEVSRRLYKGATSTVYRATCRRSGLPVALKVYFLSKVPRNVIHMIIREIRIHVELVHKHIVMLYAAFQDEKRLVLVQEYAGRGDLYGIYRSLNRRMTEAQLTHLVLAPFMEALSYLHARGICHRDIKPENVLFTNDWRLLIADFGVSIDLNQERAVTRAGTLEYMAPEVERCPLKMLPEENKDNPELAYTTAVDIWAVGVLAYELLVGFAPFVGERAPTHVSFPASTSASARDFISLALAERPEERPTALQLSRHPWLAAAMQQPQLRM